MTQLVEGPNFAYSNCGIDMVIPFHPRVYHLVDKIHLNTWAAIFSVALYNVAHEGEEQINERSFIQDSIMHLEFGYERHTVAADIAQYLANTRDLLKMYYMQCVNDYVIKAMNIDKTKSSTQSGDYTVRKIIHYWLRTELSHLCGKSTHHTTWSTVSDLFKDHGVLLPAIWLETFGLYAEEPISPFAQLAAASMNGDDVTTIDVRVTNTDTGVHFETMDNGSSE
ncbi:hypothetical protein OBP_179 [Pseudomonas phage OBP]|uniref:hypothetical protein n=1 Tax=Pseudomonas phage OBP TaxID=1124849 RepID=UPI000240D593|nr:hypothetical protein OBP_179 [Pseudomonas phage OBP]AEV89616.1 hypothetical protein OBP_179 [Pseudomonas phage OBP]